METLEKSVSFWEESLHMLKLELEQLEEQEQGQGQVGSTMSVTFLEEEEGDGGPSGSLALHLQTTISQLEPILSAAKQLQHLAQELYLDEGSILYSENEYGRGQSSSQGQRSRLRSVGSVESFMSAEDWLSDDEDIRHSLETAGLFDLQGQSQGSGDQGQVVWPLYEAALSMVKAGAVPYR